MKLKIGRVDLVTEFLKFLRLAAGALIAVVLGYFILVVGFGRLFVAGGEEVAVPEVIGHNVDEAERALADAGLVMKEIGVAKDSSLPEGFVVEQDPEPGIKVRKGRTVKVRVSAGLAEVHVPNVVGRTLRQAELVLTRIGLQVGEVTDVHDDTVPKDHVIDQTPKAREKVNRGTKINLLISLGSEEVTILMPANLIGLTVDEAAKMLKEYELGVGNVTTEPSMTVPAGRIIRQAPDIGEQVKKGDAVDLVISSGPPTP
ncbi:MAG: PASTA domain-containing protein [Candidatus Coatesbacteria bacterium]|nr:MAG: PASTA domain-containing protein [Candidatus Coatesbacteria bacterium]